MSHLAIIITLTIHLSRTLSGFTNTIALVAGAYGILTSLSPTLQIAQMRKAGSSASLSRPYLMISIGGYLIWFVYGVAMHNMPLIASDAIGGAMQVTALWWAYRLRPGAIATA